MIRKTFNTWGKRCLLAASLFLTAGAASSQTLIWSDEFNGTSIDGSKWQFENGDGCPNLCGWGNAELQSYTNRRENARVEGGRLIIEARRENWGSRGFTSARLKTQDRFSFQYGTIEARIKVPNMANGLWPAFWMLGANNPNWPARGEIDIIEMGAGAAIGAGVVNRRLYGTLHWDVNGQYANYGRHWDSPSDLTTGFHIYRTTWDANFLRMYIDNQLYYEIDLRPRDASSLHEFHAPFFFLLNVAVGGNFTGIHSNNAITAPLPGRMEVDYIRVYR